MSACGLGPWSSGSGKVEVAAAENFWGSIATQVGGDRAHVTSVIANPDTDPHDYEPTPADAKLIAGAKYVIVNGAGYDAWAPKLLAANPVAGRVVLTISDFIGVSRQISISRSRTARRSRVASAWPLAPMRSPRTRARSCSSPQETRGRGENWPSCICPESQCEVVRLRLPVSRRRASIRAAARSSDPARSRQADAEQRQPQAQRRRQLDADEQAEHGRP